MIYLDYSATTKVDERVFDRLKEVSQKYYANPNSVHKIGIESNEIINEATSAICGYLNIKTDELIYTSGSSESNNAAIKGVTLNYKGKHIITTNIEHSSILSPLGYLSKKGYTVDFVKLDENGIVDLEDLKSLITDDTVLVSIASVNSELGILEPIEEIALLLKKYPNVIFHSDITQSLGKVNIDLTNVDLASFSLHKIYGFKGIGGLIKKEHIKLTPLIHGGKSTTIYRSGTPQTELIDSAKTCFDLLMPNVDKNYEYVKTLNDKIRNHCKKHSDIYINSPKDSIPHILNFSILGKKSDEIQAYFSDHDIYISTKSACSSNKESSLAVFELTKSLERSISSIRVSLSYKTTEDEIDEFLKVLDNYIRGE